MKKGKYSFILLLVVILVIDTPISNCKTMEKEDGRVEEANIDKKPRQSPKEFTPDFVHPREFEKIAESNFVGRWEGEWMTDRLEVVSIEVEVKRTPEDRFLCQLQVPKTQTKIYITEYKMGMNILEGEGFQMMPIMGGYAEFRVSNHPKIPKNQRVKLSLVGN